MKKIKKTNKAKNAAPKKNIPWTLFWDAHSGGDIKEGNYDKIYIQAPEKEAVVIFYNRFGHNPNRVSCTCCGEDYSISESKTLEQASAFHRGCYFDDKLNKYVEKPSKETFSWNKYLSLEEYIKKETVLVIYDKDIKKKERVGAVPEQGYVWV